MVVTRNIETAIHYYQKICELLIQRNAGFKAIITFSGTKTIDGIDYTEECVQMNGFPSKDIEEQFNRDDYRLLVVANKYLTGFDQPKLTTMYVDKNYEVF